MEFKNKEIERQYLEKVEHIRKLIDAPVEDTKYLWDATVENYAKKIEQVSRVLSDKILNDKADDDEKKSDDKNKDFDVRNELKSFLSRCASPEFQIALVGTIKAGKSTLINALLNYELASTRVTPETAALTKFKHADEDSITVSFYNAEEWDALWKSATKAKGKNIFVEEYEEKNSDAVKSKWVGHEKIFEKFSDKEALRKRIEEWTSSTSPSHYFVKEVLVGLKDFYLPEGVLLIDTPGLNDMVEFRSNITRDYINSAHAVFMCVTSKRMEATERLELEKAFTNTHGKPEKVYVIATQVDTLNEPKEDWERQKADWTKTLKGDVFYKNVELVNKNVIPVSAYLYSKLQAYRNNQLDKKGISKLKSLVSLKLEIDSDEFDENFQEIEDFTNIKFLYEKLQTEVVQHYKADVIQKIIGDYKDLQKHLFEDLGEKKKAQQDKINDSQLDVDEIRRKREEKLAELQAVQNDKRELSEFIRQLQAATEKRIEEVVAAIKS